MTPMPRYSTLSVDEPLAERIRERRGDDRTTSDVLRELLDGVDE